MSEIILDLWQQEVLDHDGNIAVRAGRQVGKSTIIAIKAAEFAVKNRDKTILIVASVERQAYLLFEKTLNYLLDHHKSIIKKGRERPTKHIINLSNGSRILCLPLGMSGNNVRGYTCDMVIVDECAFCPENAFQALIPMLTVTKGHLIALSTPFGKGGFFYNCFSDPTFRTWHIKSEDCPRADREFLARQKASMTKAAWGQEFCGEFIDELRQFFPTELIQKAMTLHHEIMDQEQGQPQVLPYGPKVTFLGVDVARCGGDETVLVAIERIEREKLRMIDIQVAEQTLLTDTILRIKKSDMKYHFRKIYIDDGGMGVGVFDPLLADEQTKRKVIAINNSTRSLDRDNKQRKKLIKEDLYNNLLWLMEGGKIELFDEPEILLSLRSVQYEYTEKGDIKIFGNYTHIAEALVRAAWCMKDKKLNVWVR